MAENLLRQSQRNGELATARWLTVAETCDLQCLNILAYLAGAIARRRGRQPPPSLLPDRWPLNFYAPRRSEALYRKQ
jgi:hypothetical protein